MSHPNNKQLKALAEQKGGAKLTEPGKKHVANRLYQLVTGDIKDKQWRSAFQHLADHFHPPPTDEKGNQKTKHTQYIKRYCSEDAVRDLLRQAISKPSESTYSLLTDDSGPNGKPCLVIKRHFSQQVGTETDQHTIVVVGDLDGNLVTGYPASTPPEKGIKT